MNIFWKVLCFFGKDKMLDNDWHIMKAANKLSVDKKRRLIIILRLLRYLKDEEATVSFQEIYPLKR